MVRRTGKPSPEGRRVWVTAGVVRRVAPYASLLAMAIVLSLLSPHFLTLENLFAIGVQMAVIAIMAIGQILIIISAGIDLSVGSVMALAGVICTMLVVSGVPIGLGILAGTLVGGVCGLVNGSLIAYGFLPPFIATLGMMGIARGAALLLTGGVPIFGLPPGFNFLGGGRILFGLPVPVAILIALALAGHFVLTRTRFGRYVFAIGSNAEAARLSGINVRATLTRIYTYAGLLYGFAGVLMASRLSTGQPTAGTGYELDVIAACVIGGASLSGGEGTVLGAIMGALIMGVLRNGCNLLDISAFWQQIAIGVIIVAAVFSDQYRKHKLGRFG
ncbi:MAG: ABC transporter permease [candidate division KSB1 bacterium]|nr:ABC transporter permease [candidate division KSB1 bacterium]